jgi:hypothetical protein
VIVVRTGDDTNADIDFHRVWQQFALKVLSGHSKVRDPLMIATCKPSTDVTKAVEVRWLAQGLVWQGFIHK